MRDERIRLSAALAPKRNRMRAADARAAFAAYCKRRRCAPSDDGLVDLIADCGHLARQRGWDYLAAVEQAVTHWLVEERHPDGLEAASETPKVSVSCRCRGRPRKRRRAHS